MSPPATTWLAAIKFIIKFHLLLYNYLVLIISTLFFSAPHKKIVPSNVAQYLTPLALAHWIMCDGSKHNSGLHLNTYGFSSEDIHLLMSSLNKNFNVNTSILPGRGDIIINLVLEFILTRLIFLL